jgi:hypothetical protein
MSAVLSDRELAQRFRQAGRRAAERKFDIRDSAANLHQCWRDVIAGRAVNENPEDGSNFCRPPG